MASTPLYFKDYREGRKSLKINCPARLLLHGVTYPNWQIISASATGAVLTCRGMGDDVDATRRLDASAVGSTAIVEIPSNRVNGSTISSPGKVRYVSDTEIEIRFIRPRKDILRYLVSDRDLEAGSASLDAGAPTPLDSSQNGNLDSILQNAGASASRFVSNLFGGFQAEAEKQLLDASDTCGSNAERADLSHAIYTLQSHQEEIRSGYIVSLENAIRSLVPGQGDGSAISAKSEKESELGLVDLSEFDDWVSVVRIGRSIDAQYMAHLDQLDKCLTYLFQRPIADESNPFSPYFLLWSLKETLDPYDLSILSKQLIYKAFHREILSRLEVLYEELNAVLPRSPDIHSNVSSESRRSLQQPTGIHSNVSSESEHSLQQPTGIHSNVSSESRHSLQQPTGIHSNVSSESGRSLQQPTGIHSNASSESRHSLLQPTGINSDVPSESEHTSTGAKTRRPSHSRHFTSVLSSLQGLGGTNASEGGQDTESEGVASRGEVIRSLDRIPIGSAQPYALSGDLESFLRGEGGPARIDNAVRSAIDGAHGLVSSLKDDSRFGSAAQGLIDGLEKTLIREAIDDPGLFDEPNHPARKLLDTFDELAPYLSAQDGQISKASSPALEQVRNLIASGLQEPIGDLVAKMEQILASQKDRYSENLAIVVEKAKTDDSYLSAQQSVVKVLSGRITGRPISILVKRLLHLGWARLLVNTVAAGDSSKKKLRVYVQVLDLFLKTFLPGSQGVSLSEKIALRLQRYLKKGFSEYPVHQAAAAAFMADVSEILRGNLDVYQEFVGHTIVLEDSDVLGLFLDTPSRSPDCDPGESVEPKMAVAGPADQQG